MFVRGNVMASYIEIAGIILIIVGILYTFLKALGILGKGSEEGEIESKMFTLKGGPGIILVGLGVLLLIIGYVGESPTPSSSDTYSLESSQAATEKTAEKQFPTSQPIVQPVVTAQPTSPTMSPERWQTPASQPEVTVQEQKITKGYLLGTWSSTQSAETESISFYSDDSFYLQNYNLNTGETYYTSGTYTVSGSQIILEINMNPVYFLITYIDQNTFQIESDVYIRVG